MLDLTRFAPGLYCTMILGDLGAEVLRIDQPQSTVETDGAEVERARTATRLTFNRNKKSIVLNLRETKARRIFYQLCEKADVIVEGFRPGTTKRLGADYETVSKLNPRLIYCSITGYGQDGPYRDVAGHDINYISIAGALSMVGQRKGPPAIPLNLLGDYAGGGLRGAFGIVVALLARERTGRGQYIDISMMDGVVFLLASEFSNCFATGISPSRGETWLNGGVPYYNIYKTKDHKYISVGCLEPKFWRNLCTVLGREDLIPYQFDQSEKREEIFSYLREVFQTKTRNEWFDLLGDKDTCVSKVLSLDEAACDPQLIHRKMFVEVDSPKGKMSQVGIALKLSDTPGQIRSPAPLAGQHTEEVLADLGYSPQEIKVLHEQGIVV